MKRVERQRLELKEHREQFLFIELIVNTFTICLLWLTVMSVIDIGERKHAGNILLILFIFSQENVFLNTKYKTEFYRRRKVEQNLLMYLYCISSK